MTEDERRLEDALRLVISSVSHIITVMRDGRDPWYADGRLAEALEVLDGGE